jgi:hypothetical protein
MRNVKVRAGTSYIISSIEIIEVMMNPAVVILSGFSCVALLCDNNAMHLSLPNLEGLAKLLCRQDPQGFTLRLL